MEDESHITIEEVINIIDGILLSGDYKDTIDNIVQDTRLIQKGDTFIAFTSEKTDGNDFVQTAIDLGAKNCIITSKKYKDAKDCNIILVEDAQKALEEIISYKLDKINPIVIGITGSVGKTSTKEAIYNVVCSDFDTFKSPKNFNSQRGLPLACSQIENQQVAILEMGMDDFGQIDAMSAVVRPNIGIITNIGSSHIGILGSRENILKAKAEIVPNIKKGGYLILNKDNDLLSKLEQELQEGEDINLSVITYGINNPEATFNANIISKDESGTKFSVSILGITLEFQTNLPGDHNVYNSLCAIIVGKILEIPIEKIKEKLASMPKQEHRLEKFEAGTITVYDDTYNSSFESFKAGIDVLKLDPSGKKLVYVIGDVLELGDFAKEYHEKMAQYILDNPPAKLILAGENAKYIQEYIEKAQENLDENAEGKIEVHHFKDSKTICQNQDIIEPESIVYVKASHGMDFKKIIDSIKEKYILDIEM